MYQCQPAVWHTAQDKTKPIGGEVFYAGKAAEDITIIRYRDPGVDDDNTTASKNDPHIAENNSPAATSTGLFLGQWWGWNRLVRCKTAGIVDIVVSFHNGLSPLGKTYYKIFLYLFIMHCVREAPVSKTNTALRAIKCVPIELSERATF